MGAITLFFLSVLTYLAFKGRLGTYVNLAITPAPSSTPSNTPQNNAVPGGPYGQGVPGSSLAPPVPAAPAAPSVTIEQPNVYTPYAFPKTPTVPAQNPLDIQNLMPGAIFGKVFAPLGGAPITL